MNRLSRYIASDSTTAADPCTGCGARFRVGASVWQDYPGPTTRRLCDTCAATAPATPNTCSSCGEPAIHAGGRHLNPDRSRLGRYLPDGTELTPRQQADITIRGHHLHHCTTRAAPTPQATQEALF